MIVGFTDTAFEEYNYWCENNKKIHKKIKELINCFSLVFNCIRFI